MRILAHSSHLRWNVPNRDRAECREARVFARPPAGARTGRGLCDMLEVFGKNNGFSGLCQRIRGSTDVDVFAAHIRCVGG